MDPQQHFEFVFTNIETFNIYIYIYGYIYIYMDIYIYVYIYIYKIFKLHKMLTSKNVILKN